MKLRPLITIFIFLPVVGLLAQTNASYQTVLREKQLLLQERNNPYVRAFLELIARSECGSLYFSDHKGYRSRYPSTVFTSFDAHPKEVLCAMSGDKKLCSSAAGRYMFLESVWNNIAERLYLSDFSPLNQDIAALYLIKERKALEDVKKGDIKAAIPKLNKIWSSFPGAPYKQPVKKMKDMEQFYALRVEHFKKYLKGY